MTTSQTANRVRVDCPCGKKYRCRTELLGKRFKCRACGNSVKAIVPETHRPDLVSSMSNCPRCGEGLLPEMNFCLVCGHGLETGQSLLPDPSVAAQTWAPSTSRSASAMRTLRDVGTPNPSGERKKRNRVRDVEDVTSTSSSLPLMFLVMAALTVIIVSYLIQAELNGRWFLGFYGTLLVGCWGFSELNRDKSDQWLPFGISLATFLSVGAMRIYYGMNQGMEKFGLLLLMMFAGATMIAVGIDAVSGKKTTREIRIYVFLPGMTLALTLFCLLWTFGGPLVVVIAVGIMVLFATRSRGYGGYGNCSSSCSSSSSCSGGSSCGGGGCGGGGCGGCGGD